MENDRKKITTAQTIAIKQCKTADDVVALAKEHGVEMGTMTGRGELDRIRLAIVFSQWDDVYAGLRSMGWPGDVEAFREAIEPWRELGSVAACVDVTSARVRLYAGDVRLRRLPCRRRCMGARG